MMYSLRIFRDLSATGSFTGAAVRNHITQSAVSHHIRIMEEKFGNRLIIRGRRSVRLTEAGKKVLHAAQDVLTRIERLESSLRNESGEISGEIRIATTIAMGLHELPLYSGPFSKAHPKVTFRLNYTRGNKIYEHLLDHEADLALIASPKQHPLLKIHVFKKSRAVIIVPISWSFKVFERSRLPELFQKPFIALEKGLPTHHAIDRMIKALGVRSKTLNTFDNIESIKQAVEFGLGFSVVPEVTITKEVQLKRLRKIVVPDESWEYPMAVITRKNAEPSHAVQAFLQFIHSLKTCG